MMRWGAAAGRQGCYPSLAIPAGCLLPAPTWGLPVPLLRTHVLPCVPLLSSGTAGDGCGCTTCKPGEFSLIGGGCTPCPRGTYSNAGERRGHCAQAAVCLAAE